MCAGQNGDCFLIGGADVLVQSTGKSSTISFVTHMILNIYPN